MLTILDQCKESQNQHLKITQTSVLGEVYTPHTLLYVLLDPRAKDFVLGGGSVQDALSSAFKTDRICANVCLDAINYHKKWTEQRPEDTTHTNRDPVPDIRSSSHKSARWRHGTRENQQQKIYTKAQKGNWNSSISSIQMSRNSNKQTIFQTDPGGRN